MAILRKLKFDLQEHIADVLFPVVPPGSNLVVGLSGGVDSVVLLHLLKQLSSRFQWQLSALHVHHGISVHADSWSAFCTELCAKLVIPLTIEHVDIQPLRAMGIEAAARQLRHAALAQQLADFVVLAHHRDDQVETLLLQLLRGAGARGASAMQMLKLRQGSSALLRPLLNVTRSELENYAREHDLNWVEDDSNLDVTYPRNFLRHQVLPVIEQRFPAYRTTLARSTLHFAEAAELLEELAAQDAGVAIVSERLSVLALSQLSAARGKNLLRYFFARQGAPLPDSSRLEEMLRQLCRAGEGAHICIEWQGWQLRCYRQQAYVIPAAQPPVNFSMSWHGEEKMVLPASHGVLSFERVRGRGFSLARVRQAGLSVRPRKGGESIKLDVARPRQSLRNLVSQQGVPPWQRALLPLLYCGSELVWVPGVASAPDYAAQADEEGVLVSWQYWASMPASGVN